MGMSGKWTIVRVLAIASVLIAALAVAAGALSDSSADEQRFVELINGERAQTGARPMVVLPELSEKARRHAGKMADAGRIFHSDDLGEGVDGWYLMGENVGRGGNIETLHQAFMDSPGHRENILNPRYDAMGIGVVWDGGVPYVVEVFMDSIEELKLQFSPPFSDDDGSVHETDIVELHEMGITRGCAPDRFCPQRDVTRGEFATMLVRALDLPEAAGDSFIDDDRSEHESAIEALAASGVTHGCAPERFCPDRPITRGELASFLTRALGLPTGDAGGFSDTAGSVHRSDIDALAASGITKGCTDSTYCPNANVTRGQLASFLVRAIRFASR